MFKKAARKLTSATMTAWVIALLCIASLSAPTSAFAQVGGSSLSSATPTIVPSSAPIAGIAPTSVNATAAVLVKTSSGQLYAASITNNTTAAYMVIMDAATVPAPGATISPKYCFYVSASSNFGTAWFYPMAFTTGLVVGLSTTCTSYQPAVPTPLNIAVQAK